MKIYYTAKDIEEMAAKGMQQLELGPGVTLTDFAKETAQQLGIALVESGNQPSPSSRPKPAIDTQTASSKFNKPRGCMHDQSAYQAAASSGQPADGASSNTVNKLIDLMGKVIKRGG
jgi:hypothetical protein